MMKEQRSWGKKMKAIYVLSSSESIDIGAIAGSYSDSSVLEGGTNSTLHLLGPGGSVRRKWLVIIWKR